MNYRCLHNDYHDTDSLDYQSSFTYSVVHPSHVVNPRIKHVSMYSIDSTEI